MNVIIAEARTLMPQFSPEKYQKLSLWTVNSMLRKEQAQLLWRGSQPSSLNLQNFPNFLCIEIQPVKQEKYFVFMEEISSMLQCL